MIGDGGFHEVLERAIFSLNQRLDTEVSIVCYGGIILKRVTPGVRDLNPKIADEVWKEVKPWVIGPTGLLLLK